MFTLLFFLIALLSEIVGTVAGFGSSVFFVPLAGFFFDFHQVLALTSILHVFSNAAKLVLFGRHIRLGLLLLLGVPSVAAVIAGAYLSTKLTFRFDDAEVSEVNRLIRNRFLKFDQQRLILGLNCPKNDLDTGYRFDCEKLFRKRSEG